jgi:NAD(P) transhydrogenase subunit alpha
MLLTLLDGAMANQIGVPRETLPGEARVALVPVSLSSLKKAGLEVLVEAGAGAAAGFADSEYVEKGAVIASSRAELFSKAEVLLQVHGLGSNPDAGKSDLPLLRSEHTLIGFQEPLTAGAEVQQLAKAGVTVFSMELMPRITRAQSMDSLSSMATIAGYKAVLMAADRLPKMFPMLMTAAGTIQPAKVFIVGAGVAGLQAIATARRLGAVVTAYDVRSAVKDQIQSLGAKFLEMSLDSATAEDKGGYAKELGEEFYRKQREMMALAVATSDVVITTALIPGKPAPKLITAEMVHGMAPGSVVIDIAAERGGNCELTKPGETVEVGGVTVIGPVNLGSSIPHDASQMYSRNITTFLLHLVKEGSLVVDLEDEITRETLVTRGGEVVHPRVKDLIQS